MSGTFSSFVHDHAAPTRQGGSDRADISSMVIDQPSPVSSRLIQHFEPRTPQVLQDIGNPFVLFTLRHPHSLRQPPLIINKHQQETILLASASPRRSELLNQIKVRHHVIKVPAGPGEDEPRLPGEPPLDYVQRTAREKSERARRWILTSYAKHQLSEQLAPPSALINADSVMIDTADHQPIILSADTTVCIGNDIMGKPQDVPDARVILKRLSGTTHLVHTAVVVCRGEQHWSGLSSTEVIFDSLSDEDIERYIASGEPFGKAGAYGIQGLASAFVKQIKGSYSGVMGLPLYETAQLLKKARTWRTPD